MAQQLLDALTFVAYRDAAAFTAALDYCEATDWGWAGFDRTCSQTPTPTKTTTLTAIPPPVCSRCGALGIFLKLGLVWRRYRGQTLDDIELYDPGHAPELAWQDPAMVPAARKAA